MRKGNGFARYAWAVVGYVLLVILWGAFVRATGSGAGCGSHWPLCNGEVVPRAPEVETLIELSHRLTSAFSGLLVIGLLVWAFRRYPRGHRVRHGAVLSLVFMLLEGAIGAALVLFEWVAHDASLGRVISMALHLNNTLILVAVLVLTAWWASGGPPLRLRGQGETAWLLGAAVAGMLVLGTTGAVTALGDTLFRPESLAEGLQRHTSDTAHFLERLRLWHPLLAVLFGAYLLFLARHLVLVHPGPAVQRLVRAVLLLFSIQFLGGLINVYLLAPVWMQLVHLFVADLLWIALVLLGAATLATPAVEPVPPALQPRSAG
ncbi:COX15/CtaA family protein [Rhodocaloribacter litoris]|uniref:COX15/CtaA family protein n=1 Tax=Rhodocaloribacter litoris TaxID=2558931 RepID=UPI00141FD138|nr:COX15/CtaA family protein [Rhodocaloribacter litoris]QXD14899.1 COX15/CtaA family protein [Rhodocaloribacter litoris]GIV59004.1 MAG: cytochrome oxidase assembly protein [Rhodothermaceae bacterium]